MPTLPSCLDLDTPGSLQVSSAGRVAREILKSEVDRNSKHPSHSAPCVGAGYFGVSILLSNGEEVNGPSPGSGTHTDWVLTAYGPLQKWGVTLWKVHGPVPLRNCSPEKTSHTQGRLPGRTTASGW